MYDWPIVAETNRVLSSFTIGKCRNSLYKEVGKGTQMDKRCQNDFCVYKQRLEAQTTAAYPKSQVPSTALDAIFCSAQQKPLAVFPLTWRDQYNAAGASYLQKAEQRMVIKRHLPLFLLFFCPGGVNQHLNKGPTLHHETILLWYSGTNSLLHLQHTKH